MNETYLKEALKATDEYLGVEKRILAGDKSELALHDFTYWFSRAHDLLDMLGVIEDHQEYMQNHVNTVWEAMGHHDLNLGDEPWVHVPRSDIGEELPESYIQEAKKDVKWDDAFDSEEELKRLANGLRWHHVADTYNEDDFVDEDEDEKEDEKEDEDEDEKKLKEAKSDPCWDGYRMVGMKKKGKREVPNCVPVSEGISATNRMQKAMSLHNRSVSIHYARSLKLKRASNMEQIKARAHQAARRLLLQKMLHGRDKTSLSPQERSNVEERLKQLRPQVRALAQTLVPKIIQLERSRLSSKHK